MKLASLKSGRDGQLIVVSRDLSLGILVRDIADTLQAALDRWGETENRLEDIYDRLNAGESPDAFSLNLDALAAPLPRAYQYLDGACYVSHIRRNRQARGDDLPDDVLEAPLVYQGISHGFTAWNDPIRVRDDTIGVDFEAEIAAITDDVPMGISAEDATSHIKLFVLLNDVSLRAIIPPELKRSFGFLTGKPHSALGPIAVTPDELGDLWDNKMVSGKMRVWLRDELFGDIETGIDSPFHYGDMIAHVAKTRNFEAGTIVGLGTVSNEDDSVGFGCIGEARAFQTISTGSAVTEFLKNGDGIKLDLVDYEGNSILGPIQQKVKLLS